MANSLELAILEFDKPQAVLREKENKQQKECEPVVYKLKQDWNKEIPREWLMANSKFLFGTDRETQDPVLLLEEACRFRPEWMDFLFGKDEKKVESVQEGIALQKHKLPSSLVWGSVDILLANISLLVQVAIPVQILVCLPRASVAKILNHIQIANNHFNKAEEGKYGIQFWYQTDDLPAELRSVDNDKLSLQLWKKLTNQDRIIYSPVEMECPTAWQFWHNTVVNGETKIIVGPEPIHVQLNLAAHATPTIVYWTRPKEDRMFIRLFTEKSTVRAGGFGATEIVMVAPLDKLQTLFPSLHLTRSELTREENGQDSLRDLMRNLFYRPCLAVKTVRWRHQNKNAGESTISLRTILEGLQLLFHVHFQARNSSLSRHERFMRIFQSSVINASPRMSGTIRPTHIKLVMEGVHLNLNQLGEQLHPKRVHNKGSPHQLGMYFMWLVFQACHQLSVSLLYMWDHLGIMHTDMKTLNCGIRFGTKTERFIWLDLDCISLKGKENTRACATYPDPFSNGLESNEKVLVDDKLFNTDIFRFAHTIMSLFLANHTEIMELGPVRTAVTNKKWVTIQNIVKARCEVLSQQFELIDMSQTTPEGKKLITPEKKKWIETLLKPIRSFCLLALPENRMDNLRSLTASTETLAFKMETDPMTIAVRKWAADNKIGFDAWYRPGESRVIFTNQDPLDASMPGP